MVDQNVRAFAVLGIERDADAETDLNFQGRRTDLKAWSEFFKKKADEVFDVGSL